MELSAREARVQESTTSTTTCLTWVSSSLWAAQAISSMFVKLLGLIIGIYVLGWRRSHPPGCGTTITVWLHQQCPRAITKGEGRRGRPWYGFAPKTNDGHGGRSEREATERHVWVLVCVLHYLVKEIKPADLCALLDHFRNSIKKNVCDLASLSISRKTVRKRRKKCPSIN